MELKNAVFYSTLINRSG